MIAAVVVLAVSVAYAFVQWAGSPTTMNGVATYVEDHLRSLHGGSIRSSDPEAVRRWLSRRVAFAVTVPRLPAARLEGGRLCFLEGREGVVVHYRLEGKLVSYYVMPGGTETGGPGADDFRSEANRGYHVVVWHRAGLTYALVADLPRARLSELAHVCADAIVAVRTADPVARASRPIVGTSRASVTP
ncbi:MAG TPA: hypothetical protein VKA44_07390 [Gemmatimonadota bacterium]|nr:hypothetical protein [Gemmatimonadota bacterium]